MPQRLARLDDIRRLSARAAWQGADGAAEHGKQGNGTQKHGDGNIGTRAPGGAAPAEPRVKNTLSAIALLLAFAGSPLFYALGFLAALFNESLFMLCFALALHTPFLGFVAGVAALFSKRWRGGCKGRALTVS